MQNFDSKALACSIKALKDSCNYQEREFPRFSFGDREKCKRLFIAIFKQVDKTAADFNYLQEYDEVVDWMVDTKGKGLFLAGSVGRGKTIIIEKVIKLLFFHCHRKVITCVRAEELDKERLQHIKRKKFIAIDDMGAEHLANDFGVKYEGVNDIFNAAEAENKILFVSTNLTNEEVLHRYGVRTLDRIKRLCKIVKFDGDSMRK